jgi:2,4-dienoyl-CoA reductase-like NADH-dependent reductase (Old Yellow Enzyme family)
VQAFQERLQELGLDIPVDPLPLSSGEGSPLASEATVDGLRLKNRWCIHPMEGWDANRDGSPTELTLRRWERFGASGAALIWGGEAAAVRPDGRANPHQTMAIASNAAGLVQLRETLEQSHAAKFGTTDGLVVGLQLTHSGRFCRPTEKSVPEPRVAYHHPILDARVQISADDDSRTWTDTELDELVVDYVKAAKLAEASGFSFVDIKACHGYLIHEFLSARIRPGRYGGTLEGRARLLTSIIDAIRNECPKLKIGVRFSMFDLLPFEMGDDEAKTGRPVKFSNSENYLYGFGCDERDPLKINLTEPLLVLEMLRQRGIRLINLSCGSPYYNPHFQRPAIFPPSDGYNPPEDPLVGVARQINTAAKVKTAFPDLFFVGSGYTYLQEYLPLVAQAVVRAGWIDSVGLGRMVLSYPGLPSDMLAGSEMPRKLICRTFSDCTTAPRKGLVSGCYPLDTFYKERPERDQLAELKR